jgi:hypothetical protein
MDIYWKGLFNGFEYMLWEGTPEQVENVHQGKFPKFITNNKNMYVLVSELLLYGPVGFFLTSEEIDFTEVSMINVRDEFRGQGLGKLMVYLSGLEVANTDAEMIRYFTVNGKVRNALQSIGFQGSYGRPNDVKVSLANRDFVKRRFQSALDQMLD